MPYGVVKADWTSSSRNSQLADGKPVVVVGRLKPRLQKNIPAAIERIKKLLGKRYDYVFDPDDDTYYCSELIYVSYLRPDGKPIFRMKPMTFRDQDDGRDEPPVDRTFQTPQMRHPRGRAGHQPG